MNIEEIEDFQEILQDIFCGNSPEDIRREISMKLKNDLDFKEKYELWLEEKEFKSWKNYYKELEDDRIIWEDEFDEDSD